MSDSLPLPPPSPPPQGAVGLADAAPGTKVADLGTIAPAARRPRAGVLMDGKRIDKELLIEAKWSVNGFQSADTFGLTLLMDDKPGASWPPSYFDRETIEIEILVGFPNPTASVIMGRVDDVEMDYRSRVIYLTGRDRTADLIEATTTEHFPNRTSSDIATLIATRRGLTPVVTATTSLSGTYYARDHARLTNETTEWNLLTYLAEMEGFEVFVRGRELHFKPPEAEADAPRWTLRYQGPSLSRPIPISNAPGFNLRRNLTVARDIVVEVVSFNPSTGKAIRVTRRADRTRRSRPQSQLPAQRYVIRQPRLTLEQATQLAQRKLEEFSRHERTVDVDNIPGDERVTLRHLMVLTGTKTAFDQTYRFDSISSSIGSDGYRMRIRARNMAPASQASV